jgi:hypothetical protein
MNADGTNVTRLTRHETPRDGYAYSPTWSPDGSEIAFANFHRSGDVWVSEIWIMKSDGTNARPVMPFNGCCTAVVAWAPDGTEIAYDDGSTSRYNTIYRISTVRPDGTGGKILRYGATQPDWSPDSARIVFTNDFTFGPDAIMSMDRSGADVKTVYDGAGSTGHSYPHDPAWSPDGRKIVFARLVGPSSSAADAIFTVNADGTGATGLTDGSTPSFDPNWQPILNRPPDCSNVTATPNTLWPPNDRLVPVALSGVTDPDGDQVALSIGGVTQDEPTGHNPDAKLGPASNQAKLRARRSGHGDGRVYRIAFKANDGRGGECSGTATVSVPRKKRKAAVDSAPPSYDSFGR